MQIAAQTKTDMVRHTDKEQRRLRKKGESIDSFLGAGRGGSPVILKCSRVCVCEGGKEVKDEDGQVLPAVGHSPEKGLQKHSFSSHSLLFKGPTVRKLHMQAEEGEDENMSSCYLHAST